MRPFRRDILFIGVCLGLLLSFCGAVTAGAKDFTVVIDAGHGGHDPGALGKSSKEKNINLTVALKLGKLIERNCPDVKVIYTRDKDVFIPLNRRAEIANNAKADLFISVHTNSVAGNNTAKGASTWTLGLAKSDANLEVAKRENSVILYENDYQTRYAGFDPNSSESYIIFELMQDKYMSQSVHLASLVQQQFRDNCNRKDRGVHQAGFLVLKASAMPSILVELGFISTPEEERYLNTDAGTSSLADGIYKAFLAYKREQEARAGESGEMVAPVEAPVGETSAGQEDTRSSAAGTSSKATGKSSKAKSSKAADTKPSSSSASSTGIVFKVQIMASTKQLPANDRQFKGVSGVEYYKEGGYYKYTCGASADYNEASRTLRTVKAKFKDAFLVAFKNGKKMNVNEALNESKKSK